jgi:hypothetical protein
MWENHTSFVSRRVQSSSAICLGVMRLFFILRCKPAVFYRSILWKFPLECWRGEFFSNHEDDNHNQWSVVLCNNDVTWGARWNKEGGGRHVWKAIMSYFFDEIILYFVDMWNVRKESSRKHGNLFKTVTQRRIQNELVSTAIGNEICQLKGRL